MWYEKQDFEYFEKQAAANPILRDRVEKLEDAVRVLKGKLYDIERCLEKCRTIGGARKKIRRIIR